MPNFFILHNWVTGTCSLKKYSLLAQAAKKKKSCILKIIFGQVWGGEEVVAKFDLVNMI